MAVNDKSDAISQTSELQLLHSVKKKKKKRKDIRRRLIRT